MNRLPLAALLMMSSCARPPEPPAAQRQALTALPAYNHVYGIATHNSYWLNRGDGWDLGSSGTQELLSDQLLHEHVRALEIDLHSDDDDPHTFRVYHTSSSEDFSCRYLTDCLELLRNFHYSTPSHEVINVILELKNVVPTTGAYSDPSIATQNLFDALHTQDDLDGIIRAELGPMLYQPKDFLDRCITTANPSPTMRDCARTNGWPTIDQLRGKFIVNVNGNWASNLQDFINYASNDVYHKAAFPLFSVNGMVNLTCSTACFYDPKWCDGSHLAAQFAGYGVCIGAGDFSRNSSGPIDPLLVQPALDASVFWQFEGTGDWYPSAPNQLGADPMTTSQWFADHFLSENGVIRAHDSFEYQPNCVTDVGGDPKDPRKDADCQETRIHDGIQMVQTNFPWYFVANDSSYGASSAAVLGIATDPSLRLRDPASLPDATGAVGSFIPINELGGKIMFNTWPTNTTNLPPASWIFTSGVPTTSDRWIEATVSTNRVGDTWGFDDDNLEDVLGSCPGLPLPKDNCTSYPRVGYQNGWGCIKVMDAAEQNGLELCREKRNLDGGPTNVGQKPESVIVHVRPFTNGVLTGDGLLYAPRYAPCKDPNDPNSDDVAGQCIGSMIAVAVRNTGSGAVVTAYSAGQMLPPGTTPPLPNWQYLFSLGFSQPMTKQGLLGKGDQLIAGARVGTVLTTLASNDFRPVYTNLRQLTLAGLPNRKDDVPENSIVVDRSFHGTLSATLPTTASFSPQPNPSGWLRAPVSVTLQPPASLIYDGAAISRINYQLSGAQSSAVIESQTLPAQLTVSNQGTTTISYWATDGDGNVEPTRGSVVRIDTTAPAITSQTSRQLNFSSTVTFTCSDALSGIAGCTSPVTVHGVGSHMVNGTATDRAGNSTVIHVFVTIF